MTRPIPIIGKNVRRYPSLEEHAGFPGFVLACALVQRVDGVKAFAAIVRDLSGQGGATGYDYVPWEFVADLGNPVSYDEARTHFPSLKKKDYVE